MESRLERHSEHPSHLVGLDNSIIANASRVVNGAALVLELSDFFLSVALLLFRAQGFVAFPDTAQDPSGLLASHHRQLRSVESPQEARVEAASAHCVIAGPVAGSDVKGEFGRATIGYGLHHLGSVLGYATSFDFRAHHEACYVMQKDNWDSSD